MSKDDWSQNGYLHVVKELLSRGANTNAVTTDDGYTTLMLASEMCHLDVLQLMLNYPQLVQNLQHTQK